jgi:hypothetical protein
VGSSILAATAPTTVAFFNLAEKRQIAARYMTNIFPELPKGDQQDKAFPVN